MGTRPPPPLPWGGGKNLKAGFLIFQESNQVPFKRFFDPELCFYKKGFWRVYEEMPNHFINRSWDVWKRSRKFIGMAFVNLFSSRKIGLFRESFILINVIWSVLAGSSAFQVPLPVYYIKGRVYPFQIGGFHGFWTPLVGFPSHWDCKSFFMMSITTHTLYCR